MITLICINLIAYTGFLICQYTKIKNNDRSAMKKISITMVSINNLFIVPCYK